MAVDGYEQVFKLQICDYQIIIIIPHIRVCEACSHIEHAAHVIALQFLKWRSQDLTVQIDVRKRER